MQYSKYLKSKLNDVIVEVAMNSDFTRSRKLDFTIVFNSILTMGGNSLNYEMLELYNYCQSTPTASAFVQARAKILPSAFSHVFNEFSNRLRKPKKYRGYNLLAVDGSRLNIFRNSMDLESHVERSVGKGFNALVLSAMYDLNNHIYTDAVIQPINKLGERGALIDMLPNVRQKSIIICDRGYESYNTFAHFDNLDMNFIVRIKDVSSNGILSNRNLTSTAEFDIPLTVNVTNYQRKAYEIFT